MQAMQASTSSAVLGSAAGCVQRCRQVEVAPRCTIQALAGWRKPFTGAWRSATLAAPSLPQRAVIRQRAQRGTVLASWGAPVEWSTAKVVDNRKVADNLHAIQLDIGERGAGYSSPGQYIQAKIGAECKPGFFAIASPPDENNQGVVELLIKASGEAAEAMCAAGAGAEVEVSPVQGKGFPVDKIVPGSGVDTVLLFATGSGISPIRALIESGALEADKRKQVTLYYGTRSPSATAYADLAAGWAEAGVKVVHVYSLEDGKQYVQDAFKQGGALADGASTAIVMCGQKGMCEAVTEYAVEQGVDKDRILLNF